EVGYADTRGRSGNFRIVPRDREEDRRIPQDAEVVGIVGVFPNVLAGENHIFSERLLQAGMKLVAPAGRQWGRNAWDQSGDDSRKASCTGNHQVFVERSLQQTCVRHTKHGVALLDVVSNPDPGLGFVVRSETIVEIATQ